MSEWIGFLANPDFMPHGHCYLWRPDILWTHVVSDALITLSYYVIPIVLFIFLKKRKEEFPFPFVLGLFVAFIFLCGTSHLFRIYVTWYPAYEYEGWIKAVTAFVSLLTGIVLLPLLPKLISMPGLQAAYNKNKEMLVTLKEKNKEMSTLLSATFDREERVLSLKSEVNQLLKELGQPPRYLENDQSGDEVGVDHTGHTVNP